MMLFHSFDNFFLSTFVSLRWYLKRLIIGGLFLLIIIVNIILLFTYCPRGKSSSETFRTFKNDIHQGDNYDNLYLSPKGSCWRHPPSDLPILKPNQIYTPQGHSINQDKINSLSSSYNQEGPPVSASKDSPKSLFTFAYNQCRPECCPSTYSCDRGCICTNEQQRKLLNQRGVVNLPNNIERNF